MDERVVKLDALLDAENQPKNPMRPNQVRAWQEELDRLSKIANAPPYVHGNRGLAIKRYNELKKSVDTQMRKKTENAKNADDIRRITKEVENEVIRPSMLTREEMRRNPPGAVDHYLKGEASKGIKRAITAVKRARLAQNPDAFDEPNIANLETIRPTGSPTGTSTFMADAQIPGVFAMTPKAKENWPADMPPSGTVRSPLVQAQEAELQAPPKKRSGLHRMLMSETERKAFGEKMLAARAAKQVERETPTES